MRLANGPTLAPLLAALVVPTACSRRTSPHSPLELGTVVGCYQFSWQRHDSLLTGSWVPDLVRLDSTPACPECRPDAPAASHLLVTTPRPDTAATSPGQPIPWYRYYSASHWRLVGPDTVKVLFNSNYTHWDVKLVAKDASFQGSAKYWADGGRFDTTPAMVTSRRITCPS